MDLRLPLLLAAGLLLAGCASPSVPLQAASSPAPTTGFDVLDTGAPCPSFCEPSVAAAPDGTVYVLSGYDLLASHDGGRTFAKGAFPPTAKGAPPGVSANDAIVQVAPDGDVYVSALLTSCLPGTVLCAAVTTEGLQVARSTDGGTTWASNVYLGLASDKGTIGADRQWLAFGKDGVVCLAYQRYGPLVVFDSELGVPSTPLNTRSPTVDSDNPVTCSTDRGATFGAFHSALGGAIPSDQGTLIGGLPVMTPAGVLCVPHHRYDHRDLEVACSDDGGATFRAAKVADAGDWFPMMAQRPDGSLAVAWVTPAASGPSSLQVSESRDAGKTWSAPQRVGNASRDVGPSPWIEGTAAGWRVAWFDKAGDGTNDLWEAASETGWVPRPVQRDLGNGAQGYRTAGTDYASMASLPDGRMAIVFADLAAKTTRLAVQR